MRGEQRPSSVHWGKSLMAALRVRLMSAVTAIVLALTLAGCNATPPTPEEVIGRTYVSITMVTEAVLTAYEAGAIDHAQAEKAWEAVQQAIAITTVAQQAVVSNMEYETHLHRVQAILESVQLLLVGAEGN